MPVQRLKEYLDKERIAYRVQKHAAAFTAQEVAASAHIPGKELAKTVIVRIGTRLAMAVLPASYRLDLKRLREAVGIDSVELASEQEFGREFPQCELGAMPPFGNLWGMDVWVSESLADDETIAFSAGTHSEVIQLAFDDFARLVRPRIARIAHPIGAPPHAAAMNRLAMDDWLGRTH